MDLKNNSFWKSKIEELNNTVQSDDSYILFEESLKVKNFTIKDVGVTNREITNWDKNDLLFDQYNIGTWRKFNLIGYVWIKIVKQLRTFGLPISCIKQVKNQLFISDYIFSNEPKNNLDSNEPFFFSLEDIRKQNSDLMNKFLSSDVGREFAKHIGINLLQLLVREVATIKSDYSLKINVKGELIPYCDLWKAELEKHDGASKILRESHLSISISEILADFVSKSDIKMLGAELQLISSEEEKLLTVLRNNKGLKKAVLKYSTDGSVDLIETTYNITDRLALENDLYKLQRQYHHCNILFKTEKNIVYIELTKKHKI